MKDDRLYGNDIIENAIAALAGGNSGKGILAVLETLERRMAEGGYILIPVELPQEAAALLGSEKRKAEEPVQTKEEQRLVMRKLRLKDGKEALAAFTSREEAAKGQPTSIVSYPLKKFLEMAADTECHGIVLNPWGASFFLPKDIVGMVLASERRALMENQISFVLGDITGLDCDCIVNAANSSLLSGGGVDGAIHRAAGPELLEECRRLHGCAAGEAKITKGYRLKADYVIHTVGPVYSGSEEDAVLLASCYRSSLELAREYHLHSIAFPAVSTGAYGYPLEEAVPVALAAITRWLDENEDYGMTVILCCFDRRTYDCYQNFIESCNPDQG